MRTTISRIQISLRLALVVATMLATMAISVHEAKTAGAYCGLADEYGLVLAPGWGREANYGDPQCGNSGTTYPYGLDGHYRGIVTDTLTDGSCVYAHYADGWPVIYDAIQAYSCSSSGSIYDFYDKDGNTYALFRLEKYMGATAWFWNNGY